MLSGNSLSVGNGSVPEGMKMYDFNSEFNMAVPKDARFLKQWNNSEDFTLGQGYSYFDKDNKIEVRYVNSPLVTHEIVDAWVKADNSTGNATFDFDGDLIIFHHIKNNGKMAKTAEDSKFKETILLQKGHMLVEVSGNDLDLIKSMMDTIEFYE